MAQQYRHARYFRVRGKDSSLFAYATTELFANAVGLKSVYDTGSPTKTMTMEDGNKTLKIVFEFDSAENQTAFENAVAGAWSDSGPHRTGNVESEIWHGIRTSVGTYQVLLQSGDSLSSGEVAGGIYAADDGALLFTSEKPDFNVFVPTNPQGTEGYLYSTCESRPAGVSQLHIEWNDMSGEWDTIGGKMLGLSGINGGWVLCFGSLSPWGTPLLSEELYFEDTIDWNNPNYNYHQDQLELADYLGYYPNPYDYGWII
jgi:hypothetical protein